MRVTKTLLAAGAASLLTAGAIFGNVLLGSAFAAGATQAPTPTTIAAKVKPASGTVSASTTSGTDTEAKSGASDTDNVQAGGQSGSQVEDATPDATSATGAKEAAETPEATNGAEIPGKGGSEADTGPDVQQSGQH